MSAPDGVAPPGVAPVPARADAAAVRELLTSVIERVAGVGLGPDVGFFEAGLTSLLLVRVHDQLLSRLGRPQAVSTLFKYPTVRSLAEHLLSPPDPVAGAAPAVAPARAAPPGGVAIGQGPDAGTSISLFRRDLRARIRARNGGAR